MYQGPLHCLNAEGPPPELLPVLLDPWSVLDLPNPIEDGNMSLNALIIKVR